MEELKEMETQAKQLKGAILVSTMPGEKAQEQTFCKPFEEHYEQT